MGKREKRIGSYITRYVFLVCALVFATSLFTFLAVAFTDWQPANKDENDVLEWINISVITGKPDYSLLSGNVDVKAFDADGNCIKENVREEFAADFENYCGYLSKSGEDRVIDRNEIYLRQPFFLPFLSNIWLFFTALMV